jgi:glycosyltransferase involved in cell wall biosynthesis/Flp pilus assembly protein TadD
VHEVITSLDPQRPLTFVPGGWVIHHYGKLDGGDVLRHKGQHYLGILLRKVEAQPHNPQARHELGVQYNELGQHADARDAFLELLRRFPTYGDTLVHLAIAYVGLEEHDRAFETLRRARKQLPRSFEPEIAFIEGNLHRDRGEVAAAERAFQQGLAANPAFSSLTNNLALLYQKHGRHEEAIACAEAGLRHNPANQHLAALVHHLTRGYARALLRADRFDEARERLRTVPAEVADADTESLRGAIALRAGAVEEAAAHLQRSLAQHPTVEAAVNLSIALSARGDHEGAVTALAPAVGAAPGDGDLLQRFGRLLGDRLASRRDAGAGSLTLFIAQRAAAFDGHTPVQRPLGGTESAVVYLARALAQRGHRVVVFNNCERPGVYDGVEYAAFSTLPERALRERPDVFVSVRFWELVGAARLAPLQIFWTGDAADQPFVQGLGEAGARRHIDFFMLQSDWQATTFASSFGLAPWQILRTRLGSAASAAEPPVRPVPGRVRAKRLVYASTPFRGLDVLLDLFPRIRAACPEAELDVFSSLKVYGISEEEDQQRNGAIYAKARQPGVNLIGSVTQRELAERLQQARVLAYPNHFAETFCIAAIEAEAAGCAVVTSALGALPETVGDGGICLAGHPATTAYQRAFVDACVALLTDEDLWQRTSARALERSWGEYRWPAIAAAWEDVCAAALREDPIVRRLAVHLAAGRTALVRKMFPAPEARTGAPPAAWDALAAVTAWRCGEGPVPDAEALHRVALHFPSFRHAELLAPRADADALVASA